MGPKKWLRKNPTCDICKCNLNKEKSFFDTLTVHGPWGLLCPRCYDEIGTIVGQEYDGATQLKIRDLNPERIK